MEKTACTQVELETGLVDVYDFGNVKLHAYRTGDPIDDEVFVVEKDGRASSSSTRAFSTAYARLRST